MASVGNSTTPKPEPAVVPNLISAKMLVSPTVMSPSVMSPVQLQIEEPQITASEEEDEFMTEGPGWCRILVIVVGMLGTTVILGVLTYLVFAAPNIRTFTTPPPSLCTTFGCIEHAYYLNKDAMLDFTDNSDWMDPKTKGDFKLRVSDIERTIWITGISAYPGKLTALYSHFPVMTHNFVVNWIESNRALARRLLSLLADESSATSESDRRTAYAEYRANSDPSQSLYLYHLNSMIMPMSLLFKPMYVPEGTQAMNYAGFGALYSQLQIKLLDTVGIQFNEHRQLQSWMTASPMARYDAKVRCFFSRETQVDLWEHLAFQVVLKAFQQSKSEAHAHGIRLQGLEEFSDDAIFYMSYCYISCARTAAKTRVVRRSHVCNAIIDTEHFRKTFACPPRSLNLPNECPRFW